MTRPKGGLRAALAAKQVRTETYRIPIEDWPTIEPLAEALQQARNVAYRAEMGDDAKAKAKAKTDVAAAQRKVDACFWPVEFRGLTDDADFDALINAHPATPQQVAAAAKADEDKPTMDLDGFNLALLVACIVDGDGMTVDDWRAELWSERWTRADRSALFATVMRANTRSFSDGIPNA